MDDLVTPAWLANEIGAHDLRIADASWFLPGDARDARAEFSGAHIPGAVFLDLAELVDTASSVPMMLPPPEKLANGLSALGIGDGIRLVLYDDSPHHTAARAWAMMRSFGIPDVAILDGGFARWRAEGRPLEVEEATPGSRHLTPRMTPRMRGQGIVDLALMKAIARDSSVQIVDARSPARFAGTEPEPRAGVVPGHIPGSTNLYYARLFDADGNWKRGDGLRAAFADAGVDPDRPIVATCGSGVTACAIAFGAHLLGQEARVYDGSWAEWGGDPSTPKASGAA